MSRASWKNVHTADRRNWWSNEHSNVRVYFCKPPLPVSARQEPVPYGEETRAPLGVEVSVAQRGPHPQAFCCRLHVATPGCRQLCAGALSRGCRAIRMGGCQGGKGEVRAAREMVGRGG